MSCTFYTIKYKYLIVLFLLKVNYKSKVLKSLGIVTKRIAGFQNIFFVKDFSILSYTICFNKVRYKY